MTFPRPPLETIDWDHLGFAAHEVNGHVESKYTAETARWSDPVFVKDPILHLHGLAPALNYGQQVFEGLKAYRNPHGQIQLFRPAMNAARMVHSSGFVSIPKMSIPLFLQCLHLAVGLNSEYVPPQGTDASLYCRAIAFASSASPGIRLGLEYTMCIYVFPVGPLHGPRAVDALIVEDIDRAAPLGTGSAKVGGNYGPMLGVVDRAIREGYGLTLHLDSKTRTAIDEFSTCAFVGVRAKEDRYTVVVSDSGQIVNSITIDSICEIAKTFGWKVEKRTIPYAELADFSEVFAAGTAAVLVPVRSIEHRSSKQKFNYKDGKQDPGSCYTRLYETLKGIQQGTVEDSWRWTEIVREPVRPRHEIPGVNDNGAAAGIS